jgi:hypothetical protein
MGRVLYLEGFDKDYHSLPAAMIYGSVSARSNTATALRRLVKFME